MNNRSSAAKEVYHAPYDYSVFSSIDGRHPWQKEVPGSHVLYRVRHRKGGKIAWFNFDLAIDMGLIPRHHPRSMNPQLQSHLLEAFAIQIIDYTAEKLGFALANMVAITSPSHIFLYGGLAKSGTVLLNPVKQYFDKFILRNYKGKVELKLSSLTNQVAVLGAAALAWKEATRY